MIKKKKKKRVENVVKNPPKQWCTITGGQIFFVDYVIPVISIKKASLKIRQSNHMNQGTQ